MPATLTETLTERYQQTFARSAELAERARTLFPNGVTHDLRHHEPFPVYIDRAQGAYKWTVEGQRLIDYWSGHGALLLGHSQPEIVAAVQAQMGRASHPGGCHELEIAWGEAVRRLLPSAERIRFTSSGTEATLMALRLARIFTGQPRVLKFAGHFHGWHDYLMPGADLPVTTVPGVPTEVAGQAVIIPPNDIEAVERTLRADPQIGCVILEPTGGHFGGVPMGEPFLQALRQLTHKLDRLLIFDEVITGFRVHPGGAQGLYNIRPDLTTLAKVLAGGLPGGAVAGRADILAALEFRPGKVKMRHPGTFNANPLSAAAGTTTLKLVATGQPCAQANAMGERLRNGLNAMFAAESHDWLAYGAFSGLRLLPSYDGPRPQGEGFVPYDGVPERLDAPKPPRLVHAFRCALLLQGVDFAGLWAMLTSAHTEADIDATVAAVARALQMLRAEDLA